MLNLSIRVREPVQEAARERTQGIQDFDEVLDEMKAQAADYEQQLAAKQAACDRQHAAMLKSHDRELQKLHVQRVDLETQVEDLQFQVASLTEHGGEYAGTVRLCAGWMMTACLVAQLRYTSDLGFGLGQVMNVHQRFLPILRSSEASAGQFVILSKTVFFQNQRTGGGTGSVVLTETLS
jgi:hypothetical protein